MGLYPRLISFENVDATLTEWITPPSSVLMKPKVPSGEVRSKAAAFLQSRAVDCQSSTYSLLVMCRAGCGSGEPRVCLRSKESLRSPRRRSLHSPHFVVVGPGQYTPLKERVNNIPSMTGYL